MTQMDHITLHIEGRKGVEAISKDNFDIKELRGVLDSVSRLFESGNKTAAVSLTAIEEGSVKFVFQSSVQAVKQLTVLFPLIIGTPYLKDVDPEVATVIESIQLDAIKKGYSYSFETSDGECPLRISPETNFTRLAPTWVEGEFYFYGEIEEAGGSSRVNVHIRTKELGLLVIDTSKSFIKNREENLLFHTCGIRAKGRQNIITGDIDRSSLELIEILDYTPVYDKAYMDSLRDSVGDRWKGVDIDGYLSDIRAYA